MIFVKILRSVRIKRSEQIFNNLLFKIEKDLIKKTTIGCQRCRRRSAEGCLSISLYIEVSYVLTSKWLISIKKSTLILLLFLDP